MLPRRLCEQLCSLQPGEPRLAFSVVWEVDEATGDIRDEWMGRSVIRSCGQLHYAHAQHVIELPPGRAAELPEGAELARDSPHSRRDVAEDIRALHGVAHKLRARRFAEGSLRLNNPKLSFRCDPHGHPLEAAVYVQREANELVEEFMLLANRRVAAVIAEACPGLAVLRNHPPPDRRKTAEVEALVARMGLPGTFCTSSSGAFQESLRRLADSAPLEVSSAVTLLSTKPMHLAQYFCTGSEAFAGNKALWRHYALAFDRYTHFTSPIRRYPDVLVHRTLAGVLGPDGRRWPRGTRRTAACGSTSAGSSRTAPWTCRPSWWAPVGTSGSTCSSTSWAWRPASSSKTWSACARGSGTARSASRRRAPRRTTSRGSRGGK